MVLPRWPTGGVTAAAGGGGPAGDVSHGTALGTVLAPLSGRPPPVHVAEEFLRHATVARAVRLARHLAAPVSAVVVDVVGPWRDPGVAVIGDGDGLLLHLRVRPHTAADRRRFLDGELTDWITAALAPFATR